MANERVSTRRLRLFDRAVAGKSNKYTWSGLAIGLLGLIVLLVGVYIGTSFNILLVGLGVLIIIVGIIRLLIGVISPATPQDIEPKETEEQQLQDDLFVPAETPDDQ